MSGFAKHTEQLDEAKVAAALVRCPPSEVLATGFKQQITRADMFTLSEEQWLNDEIINYYMNMLMERGTQTGFASTHAFNTFFYPKLLQSGHEGVKRWTRRIDIFEKDFVLIPVHQSGNHWCLSVIDFKRKEIRYYDSLGQENKDCLNRLRQYLECESLEKMEQPYNTAEWKLINVKNIPLQENGTDCGAFMLQFAECVTRRDTINFDQNDICYLRKRIVLEILNGELCIQESSQRSHDLEDLFTVLPQGNTKDLPKRKKRPDQKKYVIPARRHILNN